MATQLIAPIIHLNGDRPETLLTAVMTAYQALRRAQEALTACAPNARNYYPEPGRFEQARAHTTTVQMSINV